MVKVQRGLGKGLSALIPENAAPKSAPSASDSAVDVLEKPVKKAPEPVAEKPVEKSEKQAKPKPEVKAAAPAAETVAREPERVPAPRTSASARARKTSVMGAEGVVILPVAQLEPGMYQPRSVFSEESLHELSQSIEHKGIIQPLIVRQLGYESYEIIAGERRFRAAQMAGLHEVPVIVRRMTDDDALEIALIENVQREDLNPLEEARGYERLMREFQYTQDEIGESVGKSRSHIANLLRLLKLPPEVKTMLENGDLTMGHARALLAAEDPLVIANQIVNGGLNVRAAEALAKGRTLNGVAKPRGSYNKKPKEDVQAVVPSAPAKPKDPDIITLEETLSENLGLKVSIEDKGAGGQVIIAYETLAELDQVLQRLGRSA